MYARQILYYLSKGHTMPPALSIAIILSLYGIQHSKDLVEDESEDIILYVICFRRWYIDELEHLMELHWGAIVHP